MELKKAGCVGIGGDLIKELSFEATQILIYALLNITPRLLESASSQLKSEISFIRHKHSDRRHQLYQI